MVNHNHSNERHPLSNGRNSTPVPSIGSGRQLPKPLGAAVKGAAFLPALERLCSSKNTVQLTAHAAETWVSALSMYSDWPEIVNQAVVEMAVSEDPFPDLGKLLAKCEFIRRTQDKTLPQDSSKVKFSKVKELGEAWGLKM